MADKNFKVKNGIDAGDDSSIGGDLTVTGNVTITTPGTDDISLSIISGDANSHIEFQDSNTTLYGNVRVGASGDNLVMWAGGAEKLRLNSNGKVRFFGQLLGFAGSKGSPGYGFDGDGNTGITQNGADTLRFVTGGTAALDINASQNATFHGNVGIGTTSPSRTLDVDGSIGVHAPGTTTEYVLLNTDANNSYFSLIDSGGTSVYFDTTSADNYILNGNVGIGTSSPGAKLDVEGHTRSNTFAVQGGAGAVYEAGCIYTDSNWGMLLRAFQPSPGVAAFGFQNSAGTDLMHILDSGNVGIGTSSPSGTLHVSETGKAGAGAPALYIGTMNAGTESDISLHGNAVIGGESSVTHTVETGGFHRWGIATASETGTAGFTEWARITGTQVDLGNFSFDVDQTVGAGQDNFVLTYNNGTGLISLEAAAGGGGGDLLAANNLSDVADAATARSNLGAYGSGDSPSFGTVSVSGTIDQTGTVPTFNFNETDAGTDEKRWRTFMNAGVYYFESVNDAFTTTSPIWTVDRNGNSVNYQTWSTGGSERMRIDSSGNVGIGTTSLNSKLVVDNGATAGPATSGNMTTGQIIQAGPGSAAINIGANATGSSYTWINSGFANNAGIASEFRIYSGGSQRMVIDSSGNVGIGTTSPGAALDVNGTILAGGSEVLVETDRTALQGIIANRAFDHAYNDSNIIQGVSVFSTNGDTGYPYALGAVLTASADTTHNRQFQLLGGDDGDLWYRRGHVGNTGGDGTGWDAWAKIWTDQTDGAGSGLDADLLDGQQGSYYLDYNNLINTPVGGGTGDTQKAVAENITGAWNFSASIDFTGGAKFSGVAGVASPTLGTAGGSVQISNSDTAYGLDFGVHTNGTAWIQQHRFDATGSAYNIWLQPSGGNIIWGTPGLHQLVSNGDIQARDMRADRGDGTGAIYFGDAGTDYLYWNDVAWYLAGGDLYVQNGGIIAQGNLKGLVHQHSSASFDWETYQEASGNLIWTISGTGGAEMRLFADGADHDGAGTYLQVGDQTVWTAGNDGAGSGLDADTVDGIEAVRIVYGDNASGTTSAPNADLDDIVKSGFWQATGAGAHNGPTSSSWTWVMHHEHSGLNGYGFQLAVPIDATRLFLRRQNNNLWSDWRRLWNEDEPIYGDGTVSLPYYSFNSDTDSGMFLASAGQVGIAIGGVGDFRFASSYLSIADSGVHSSSSGLLLQESGGTAYIRNRNSGSLYLGTNEYNFIQIRENGTTWETIMSAQAGEDVALYFGDATDPIRGGFIFDTSANILQFQGYNNTTVMRMGGDYLQLGANGDEHNLNIHSAAGKGLVFYNSGVQMGDITAQDTTWLRINQNTAKNIYTPRMIRADSGFQVDALAVIQGNGDHIAQDNKYYHVGTGEDLNIWSNGTNTYIRNGASSYTTWQDSAGTAKFLFHPNSSYFRVQDSARIDFGSGNDCRFYHNGSHMFTDIYTGDWYIRDGATNRFLLDDNGSFTATGNITAYGTISDINAKENVSVITGALNKVKTLDGITYNYKNNPDRMTGVIAQQVRKVLPEAVYDIDPGQEELVPDGAKLAVRHANMVGLLIEAIKELSDKVEALENGLTK